MKRIASLVLMLGMMLICSVAFADYPKYLNGNTNYILCDGHQGVGRYVDASSLNVQLYSPPHYIIAINVVSVPDAYNGKTAISHVETREYRYEWDTKKMYERRSGGAWNYLDPNGSRADGAYRVLAGEIAFELAYGMKFGAK